MSVGCQESNLLENLLDIAGQLQKLRWAALEQGSDRLADNIADVIDSIAWAAGIYVPGENAVDPPADSTSGSVARPTQEVGLATRELSTSISFGK